MARSPDPSASVPLPRALAYSSGQVLGDTIDPVDWTAYFGIAPDLAIVKGAPFLIKPGRMSSYPGRTGNWSIQSKLAMTSDFLEPHIRYLVHRLGLPRRDMPVRLSDMGGRFRIFCYWDNYAGDRVPVVSAELEDIVASSGGTIDIDEYPKPCVHA